MRVRVFNHSEGVKILVPVYQEAIEKDTRRFFQGVPYFDCEPSELPPRVNPITGECQRCSWEADLSQKKVVVRQPCICIHNELKKLDKILDDPLSTREQKREAILDRELLIRSQRKV